MTNSLVPLDPKPLGRLLVMQSVIGSLPDEESILEFVCRGLLDIPGVEAARFVEDGKEDPVPFQERFTIGRGGKTLGTVVLAVEDQNAYTPYRPYLHNFCFMVSLVIEERKLRRLNQFHQENLEKLVAARTAELEKEVGERVRVEEALAESERLFRSTFENVAIGICLTELDGTLRMVNPMFARILGYRASELVGRNFSEFTVPEDQDTCTEMMCKLQSGEHRTINFEKRYRTRSNETVWAEVGSFLMHGEDRQPLYYITNIKDITGQKQAQIEREKLEEELRQAHKMEAIGTLAGGIAHDFNNLLAAILGFADLATEDVPVSSPARHSLAQVTRAADRAKELVQQILAFSRKERQSLAPLDLAPLIGEGLQLLRASIPATIEFKTEIDLHCGYIMGEPSQIQQILMNLCTNGAQAMEETGGVLTVSLRSVHLGEEDIEDLPELAPGEYLQLRVMDMGDGIPEERLLRIFDPYFTTKDVGKGSGMGLSVVLGLVKSHNGAVKVSNRPEGGADFRVYFPKVEASVRQGPEQTDGVAGGVERILLVEDDPVVAEMMKRQVERLGYQVTAVTESMAALDHFQNNPDDYALVITDQTMPAMTGEQLIGEIRKSKPYQPVILCTGYSARVDEKKAQALGIDGFLLKPIGKQVLAATIREVLDKVSGHRS